jgi:translation elongation factor EF-Tu-like GTPase
MYLSGRNWSFVAFSILATCYDDQTSQFGHDRTISKALNTATHKQKSASEFANSDNMTFQFAVFDALLIAGRSVIFFGKVDSGEVHVADELFLQSPHGQIVIKHGQIVVKVVGLEPSGFRVAGAKAGDNVTVVVEHVNLEPVADGFWLTASNQIHVQSLRLHGPQY